MTELSNDMNYEQAYSALRETVAALEDSKTTIEDSLALYERACRLVVYCQRKLSEAKLEITDINARVAELRKENADLF